MNFLGPALLAGLAGLALPVLAHLLGRERPREIRFAAMRFLPRAEPSVTHRRALRDVPLLLLRLLLLALLILVIARPVTREHGGLTVVAEVHDAVVLVDASRSMELRVEGETMLEHAVDRARALVRSLPPGSRVGLITSDPGGPRLEPGADPSRIEAALDDWLESGAPRPGAWTVRDALPTAAKALRDLDGDRKKVVYVIGDATARGLAELPPVTEGGTLVIPIPAVPVDQEIPEHAGLVSVDWEPAPDLDPRAVRIEAVLRRFAGTDSEASVEPVTVALLVGEQEVARARVDVPLGEDTPVEFTHVLLDEAEAPATVALVDNDDDPLPSDDRRFMWLFADEGLEVVVVNGDPSELRAHDEVFFLTTAIAAADEGRRIHLRSMAPDQLEASIRKSGASAFDGVDILVLANVRAPAPDVVPAIIEEVERGLGLWVSVGDRVSADDYNQRLGAILPLPMRETVQVGTAPGRTEARLEGIAPADLSHPIFGGLGRDPGLTGTRVRRIVLLEPDARRQPRIALAYTSGAPALLTTEQGEGRVALLSTTIDRDWADLPLRPGFVPLVTGVLDWLGGSRGGVSGTRVEVGETRRLRSDTPVVVRTPTGQEVSIAPEDGMASFDDTFVPGHYQARSGQTDGDEGADAGRSVFVVEIEPTESETTPLELDEPELEGRPQAAVSVAVPRWRWLVILAAALLGLEALLRGWKRRGRIGTTGR